MRPLVIPITGLIFVLGFLAPLVRGQPDAKRVPLPIAAKAAAAEVAAPVDLPVTRIVLFNAGVGYFHREGEVAGEARLDLRFDEADVNDLLKSLVLTDSGGGKPRAITYDTRLPVDFTLKGFAIDVTENPSMGQLLHQVRGEKIEVTDKTGNVTTGQVASVERPPVVAGMPDPGEKLNLLTEDGLQTVEMKLVNKFKFVRPELQAEFKKALEVLASSRGDNKKTVSVVFTGNGKRRVAVGYVTESPLWKASYRLTVDDKGAARIQGWASVENTTDEDWNGVKVGLVAGRPMTFRMDLYDPLFVPRPTVEPELFASLRPPMYQGGLNPVGNMGMGAVMNPGGNGFGGGFNGGIGGIQSGNQGFGGGALGVGGGQLGQFGNLNGQFGIQGQFGMQGQFGIQGGNYWAYPPRVPRPNVRELYGERLSFEEYLGRVRGTANAAPNEGQAKPVRDPLDREAGALALADGTLGEMFEYTITEPVTLPRQKSALLPILNEPVDGSRVSIYNPAVLAKHPLLGLKLVNKTKLHLAQGPVAVYDGGTFAGDARLPDLKPGETRLVSYAIDLGTEVAPRREEEKPALLAVKVLAGKAEVALRNRWTTAYQIRNRNTQDRIVVVEHPRLTGRKLAGDIKPTDQTRSFYRFESPVKAGELVTLNVTEEEEEGRILDLLDTDQKTLHYYAQQPETKPAVRAVLTKVLELRSVNEDIAKRIAIEQGALKEIADDQDRIRKNIERVPKESEAFTRYLKKFDEQETEIETRQAKVKELRAELLKQGEALKAFASTAKAE